MHFVIKMCREWMYNCTIPDLRHLLQVRDQIHAPVALLEAPALCGPETVYKIRRMPSFGIWRHLAIVRTDVLEERIASIIRVKRIREIQAALIVNIVPSSLILSALKMEATHPSE
jgi:hypothetical protein